MADEALFIAETPLGLRVRVSRERWHLIVTLKHPVMQEREDAVRAVLERPDEVRQSRSAQDILLFYKLERPKRWMCAVIRRGRGDNEEGFLITAYPTDAIKEGTTIWTR